MASNSDYDSIIAALAAHFDTVGLSDEEILREIRAHREALKEPLSHDPLSTYLNELNLRTVDPLVPPAMRSPGAMQLPELFIDLNVKISNVSRNEDSKASNVMQAVEKFPQMHLVDGAGAGKTSQLKMLAVCLAREHLQPNGGWLKKTSLSRNFLRQWEHPFTPVPILVQLPIWGPKRVDMSEEDSDKSAVMRLLRGSVAYIEGLDTQSIIEVIHKACLNGRAIFLLDSLDEVPSSILDDVLQDIQTCIHNFPGCRFIVSCRSTQFLEIQRDASYPFLHRIPIVKVLPLTIDGMTSFIQTWCKLLISKDDSTSRGQEIVNRLLRYLDNPDFREILTSPLIISIFITLRLSKPLSYADEKIRTLINEFIHYKIYLWPLQSRREDFPGLVDNEATPQTLKLVQTDVLLTGLQQIAFEGLQKKLDTHHQGGAYLLKSDVTSVFHKLAITERQIDDILAHLIRNQFLDVVPSDDENFRIKFVHHLFQEHLASDHIYTLYKTRKMQQLQHIFERAHLWHNILVLWVEQVSHFGEAAAAINFVHEFARTQRRRHRKIYIELLLVLIDMLHRAVMIFGQTFETDPVAAALILPLALELQEAIERRDFTLDQRVTATRLYSEIGVSNAITKYHYRDDTTIGDMHWVNVSSHYCILRYPVTNHQYNKFIEDPDGYRDTTGKWWDEEINTNTILKWLEERENLGLIARLPDYPAPTNWYEAVAFCRWLSSRIGCEVRLPTSREWEIAARLVDETGIMNPHWNSILSQMPWNHRESKINSTCAVGLFPEIRIAEKLDDIAGNVWEWCQGEYDGSLRTQKPLRGGSYTMTQHPTVDDLRLFDEPSLRLSEFGFRPLIAKSTRCSSCP